MPTGKTNKRKTDIFKVARGTRVYTINGMRVPGVTDVLKGTGVIDYSGMGPDQYELYTARGRAVHRAVELYDQDNLDRRALSPELSGYVKSYEKVKRYLGIDPILSEFHVYNPVRMFAGRIDKYAALRDGSLAIIDVKAGKVEDWVALQLAGYDDTIWPIVKPKTPIRRIGIELCEDGSSPLITEFKDYQDRPVFQCLVSCYHWKRNHGYIKL